MLLAETLGGIGFGLRRSRYAWVGVGVMGLCAGLACVLLVETLEAIGFGRWALRYARV